MGHDLPGSVLVKFTLTNGEGSTALQYFQDIAIRLLSSSQVQADLQWQEMRSA
jgi:hypothetical protein